MNYVTKVAVKSTAKKASEIGILINASSLSQLNIPVVDYDGDELLDELRYFGT